MRLANAIGRAEFHFCGRKSFGSLPYSDHHARMAYQPAPARRRENGWLAPTASLKCGGKIAEATALSGPRAVKVLISMPPAALLLTAEARARTKFRFNKNRRRWESGEWLSRSA